MVTVLTSFAELNESPADSCPVFSAVPDARYVLHNHERRGSGLLEPRLHNMLHTAILHATYSYTTCYTQLHYMVPVRVQDNGAGPSSSRAQF